MSGTVLDFSGDGGCTSDQATQTQVIAAQTADESAQAIVTHEGTVSNNFQLAYNGAIIDFSAFQNFIADAGLYAAINAAPAAAACVTWNN